MPITLEKKGTEGREGRDTLESVFIHKPPHVFPFGASVVDTLRRRARSIGGGDCWRKIYAIDFSNTQNQYPFSGTVMRRCEK